MKTILVLIIVGVLGWAYYIGFFAGGTGGAGSLEELREIYIESHNNKDTKLALGLVYMEGVTEDRTVLVENDLQDKFSRTLKSVNIGEPEANNPYRYTFEGKLYKENLPIVKSLRVDYEASLASGLAGNTYGVGQYRGRYYIVISVPVSEN